MLSPPYRCLLRSAGATEGIIYSSPESSIRSPQPVPPRGSPRAMIEQWQCLHGSFILFWTYSGHFCPCDRLCACRSTYTKSEIFERSHRIQLDSETSHKCPFGLEWYGSTAILTNFCHLSFTLSCHVKKIFVYYFVFERTLSYT